MHIEGYIKSVVEFVILVAVVCGLYPLIVSSISNLNTTFNNSLTNFLAGSSGIVALMITASVVIVAVATFFHVKGSSK